APARKKGGLKFLYRAWGFLWRLVDGGRCSVQSDVVRPDAGGLCRGSVAMPVSFRISDGPAAAPWLSPAIEPGQLQPGAFNVVHQLREGDKYDFRVRVYNDGNENATPWVESAATGPFAAPLAGSGGLAWPLTGADRTIVAAPTMPLTTRVQLVQQGSQYGLELQNSTGTTISTLATTLDPGFVDRRIGVTYSPNGRHVVLF